VGQPDEDLERDSVMIVVNSSDITLSDHPTRESPNAFDFYLIRATMLPHWLD
jgi:hypothetical protein